MAGLTLPLSSASSAQIIPTDASGPRRKFEYENGQRTERPVLRGGLHVWAFEAAIAVDGVALGVARVESTTEHLPAIKFGGVLEGAGVGELVIAPRDQFSLRLRLVVDRVEAPSTPSRTAAPAAASSAAAPVRRP